MLLTGTFLRTPSLLSELIFGIKFKIFFRVDNPLQLLAYSFNNKYAHMFVYVIERNFMRFYQIVNNTTVTNALFFSLMHT